MKWGGGRGGGLLTPGLHHHQFLHEESGVRVVLASSEKFPSGVASFFFYYYSCRSLLEGDCTVADTNTFSSYIPRFIFHLRSATRQLLSNYFFPSAVFWGRAGGEAQCEVLFFFR
jgi:hypothetical protein